MKERSLTSSRQRASSWAFSLTNSSKGYCSLGKGAIGQSKDGISNLWMALECVVARQPVIQHHTHKYQLKQNSQPVFVLVKWSHMIQTAAKANKFKANTCRLGQIPESCSKCTLRRYIFQLYSHKTTDNFQALTQSSPMESSHKRQNAQIWASRTLRERKDNSECKKKFVILGARVHNVSFTVFIL